MSQNFLREFPSPRAMRLGLLVGIPLVSLLGPRLVAWADVALKKEWNEGDTLTAADLNSNFKAIEGAINKPVAQKNNKSISTSATYCNTAPDVSGVAGGYKGMKAMCEGACGSPSAHLCTSEELVRSAALGDVVPQGWYTGSTGLTDVSYKYVANENVETQISYSECQGWTGADANQRAPYWIGYPNYDGCNKAHKVLCCD